MACQRAEDAGAELADALLARAQGSRPVTLLGFSLGARAIVHCLRRLAAHRRGHGVVLDVYLLGCPTSGAAADWAAVAPVVGGRLINGYSTTDWLLKFLFRGTHASVRHELAPFFSFFFFRQLIRMHGRRSSPGSTASVTLA